MTSKDEERFYVFENLDKDSLDYGAFNSSRWVKNESKRIRDRQEEVIKEHSFLVSVLKDYRGDWNSILDFGGSLGTALYALDSEFSTREFSYSVLETPEVCEKGRKIHVKKSAEFLDSLDKIKNKIDIIYLRTSLQYVKDWKRTLLALCDLAPSLMVFDHLTAGKVSTNRLVQNYYGSKIPYWIISADELINVLSGAGYECRNIEKSQCFSSDMFDPAVPEDNRVRSSIRFTAVRKIDEK